MRGVLTTSWDDGHPLDQRVADLLAKYGLAGTFYVPFKHSRPLMTDSEMRELCKSFELGAHTVSHTVLTTVSAKTAEFEIAESKKRIENVTGYSCDVFCFPSGRFRASHIDMVRRAGFRCARTVELLSTDFPRTAAGVHLIPTTVQAKSHNSSVYLKNAARRFALGNFVRFALSARAGNWVETAKALLKAVAERGGVFHLWGHSWEIEEHQQWSQLEEVLRQMGDMRTLLTSASNSKLPSFMNTTYGSLESVTP